MPVIIPLFENANFSEAVTLDNVNYILSFKWNTRGEFWTMDIYDGNGEIIAYGFKLVIWYPLTVQHNNVNLPAGTFVLVDPSAATQYDETGRNDFVSGRKLELLYVSAL
jgi:hypothetical protein